MIENFHHAIVTVAGQTTFLNLRHHQLTWWFAIPGERAPSRHHYYYNANYLSFGQRVNGVEDDDGDVIMVAHETAQERAERKQQEALQLHNVMRQQMQLLRQMRGGGHDAHPEDNVGMELNPVFEEEETATESSVATIERKMHQLSREFLGVKIEKELLIKKLGDASKEEKEIEKLKCERTKIIIQNI